MSHHSVPFHDVCGPKWFALQTFGCEHPSYKNVCEGGYQESVELLDVVSLYGINFLMF